MAADTAPALLPCPFCGVTPRLRLQRWSVIVECHTCWLVMKRDLPSRECREIVQRQLVDAWNRRTNPDRTAAAPDALGEMQSAHLAAKFSVGGVA